MFYLSVRETAEKWGVNISLVRRYCQHGRIPGAVQKKDGWCIPEDAVRPTRTVLEHAEESVLPELVKKLKNQKKKRNYHGLYDFVVVDLTYGPGYQRGTGADHAPEAAGGHPAETGPFGH